MPRSLVGATRRTVFLLAAATIVHAAAVTPVGAQKSKSPPPTNTAPAVKGAAKVPVVRYGTDGLPPPVVEMREAILATVKSGSMDDLMVAIELNEIKPTFGDGPVADPIGHLKSLSGDGEGREILAALGNLLDAGYATVPLGRDLENNRIYVWPYFAETGIADLTPAQKVELYRLVPPAAASEMLAKGGKYTHWRVGIAADGTWHVMAR